MPRYYFHIHDGADFPDRDGTMLPDLEAARHEAIRLAGSVIRELGSPFWDERHGGEWTMEVADQQGNPLFKLRFSGQRLN